LATVGCGNREFTLETSFICGTSKLVSSGFCNPANENYAQTNRSNSAESSIFSRGAIQRTATLDRAIDEHQRCSQCEPIYSAPGTLLLLLTNFQATLNCGLLSRCYESMCPQSLLGRPGITVSLMLPVSLRRLWYSYPIRADPRYDLYVTGRDG